MLSERQLDALMEAFTARMQRVVDQYLQQVGEHLRDIGQLTPTDVHRLTELKRLNANTRRVKREIARAARLSIQDVEKVFQTVAESNEAFARQYYGSDQEAPNKGSAGHSAPIERILKAQLRITKQTMQNLSQTTIETGAYRRAIDVAVQTVQGGLADYNSAIRKAMIEVGGAGLRVKYPSGYSRRLDSAVRQNVLDGVRAVNNDTLRQLGKEFGADGVQISLHALCAEDHLPYQGRRFTNKQFERLQNRLPRPFGMWNCKHTMFPVLMSAPPTYSEEEIEQYRKNSSEKIEIDGRTLSRYEWTQEQRRIEAAIRQQKDIANLARASGDMKTARQASAAIDRLYARYDRISDAAGLDKQYARAYVRGYRETDAGERLKKASGNGTIEAGAKGIQSVTKSASKSTDEEDAVKSEIRKLEERAAQYDAEIAKNEQAQMQSLDFKEVVRLSEEADKIAHERSVIHDQIYGLRNKVDGIRRDKAWHVYEKPFEKLKTTAEVEEKIKQFGWFSGRVSLKACPPETAKSIAASLNRVFERYPGLKGKMNGINTTQLGIGQWAGFNPMTRRIVISDIKYSQGIEELKAQYAELEKANFFPKGTDYRSIFVHEMGHAIDYYIGRDKKVDRISYSMQYEYLKETVGLRSAFSEEAMEYVKWNVSRYATTNQKELLAECFSEWMTSVNPRDAAKWYGERIEEEYRRWMKND